MGPSDRCRPRGRNKARSGEAPEWWRYKSDDWSQGTASMASATSYSSLVPSLLQREKIIYFNLLKVQRCRAQEAGAASKICDSLISCAAHKNWAGAKTRNVFAVIWRYAAAGPARISRSDLLPESAQPFGTLHPEDEVDCSRTARSDVAHSHSIGLLPGGTLGRLALRPLSWPPKRGFSGAIGDRVGRPHAPSVTFTPIGFGAAPAPGLILNS